jgi:hypothetical protein
MSETFRADIIGIDTEHRILKIEKTKGHWNYKYRENEIREEVRAILELRQMEGWGVLAQGEFETHGKLYLLIAVYL